MEPIDYIDLTIDSDEATTDAPTESEDEFALWEPVSPDFPIDETDRVSYRRVQRALSAVTVPPHAMKHITMQRVYEFDADGALTFRWDGVVERMDGAFDIEDNPRELLRDEDMRVEVFGPPVKVEKAECPVCFTESAQTSLAQLWCSHYICHPCLEHMIATDTMHLACPLCRDDFKSFTIPHDL